MAEPRVDLKIGIDFDDFEVQIAKKAQQIGTDFETALAGKAAPAAAQLGGAIKRVGAETDDARERLREYGAAGAVVTGIWAAWQMVGGAVRTVTNTVIETGRALLDAQIFAERFAIVMRLATGGDAAREMEATRATANRLGLELQTTAGFYSLFAAAARGTRLEGEAARQVFVAVAEAAAVMGLSAYDTEGVFRALTQMISKGTVQAEEMRGQLGERLPGAFQIAARALNVTTGEFSKMLERGEVVATEFLPAFARQLREEFGGAVEQAAQRTQASVNRMATAWLDFKTATSESGVGAFLAGQLNVLTDAMNDYSRSVRAAKAEGDGFFGQFLAAGGAVLRFLNPLNAVSYQVQDTGARLKEAREELAGLETALARQPNNLLLKEAIADTKRLIASLESASGAAATVNERFLAASPSRIDRQLEIDRLAAQNRAMQELQKTTAQLAGVNEEYETGMRRVSAALASGAITAEHAAVLQGLLRERFTEAGKEAHRAADAAARYRRETLDKIAALEDELASTDKLTKGQKLLAEIERDLASGKGRLTAAEQASTRAKLEAAIATEKKKRADEEAEKAAAALLKADQDTIATELRKLDALNQSIAKQQEEIATLGLSKEALGQYNIGKQETILLDLQRKALTPELSAAELAAIEAQIGAQERLIALMREGAAKRGMVEAAEEARKEWERTSESIERSLTDALLRGFESGKGIAASFKGALVNLFNTLVLRPIIQPIASSLAGGALGLLGMAPAAAGAATGSGGLGLLGNAGGLLGSIGTIGSFGATGLMSTLASWGLVGTGGSAALGAGFSAAGSLMTGGNLLGGAAMGLGAALPYVGAVLALASLIRRNKTSPAVQNYSIVDAAGNVNAADWFGAVTPNLRDANAYDTVLRPIAASVSQLAASLGGAAGDLRYGLLTSASPDNKGAQVFAQVYGGGIDWRSDTNASNESMQSRIEEALPRMLLAGLQGAELPRTIAEYFRSIDLTSATQEQVNAAIAAAQAAYNMAEATRNLGGAFAQLGGLSVEARGNILALTGGLEAFNQKVGGYLQLYYSAQEQAAIQAARIAGTLTAAGIDISGLDTRGEFRALVDALDLSGASGQGQLAALLNVAQGFAGLSDVMAEQGLTLEQLAAMAPVDRLAELTMSGQETQQQQLAAIDDRLAGVTAAVDRVVTAVEGLIEDQRTASAKLADNTGRTADTLQGWAANGMPPAEA